MSKRQHEEFRHFAQSIVGQAGNLVMRYHGKRRALKQVWTSLTHLKTAADDASDALMRSLISKSYPRHNIMSEEGDLEEKGSKFTWVLDGVDGTIGFTGINDNWSVCAGLCKGKEPIAGAVNARQRRELYSAALGSGAFLNGRPIRVSNLVEINKVKMGLDSGKENRIAHLPYWEKLYQPNKGITVALAMACASVPLCFVASGVLDAYLATSLAPEDMAAAVVIIREAGGKVTDLKGREWQLGEPSILAANPVLHKRLMKFLGLK